MLRSNQLIGFGSRGVVAGGGGIPFSATKLLLGVNGIDGATATSDESASAHTISFFGNAQLDTAQKKLGSASLLLDGTGDYISAPDHADWNLGSGLFGVESFIRPASVSGNQFLIAQWGALGSLAWVIWLSGSTLTWNVSTSGNDNNADMAGGTVVTGSWQHVAATFDGTKYRLFLEGVMVDDFATPRTIFNSTAELSIGAGAGGTFTYNGHIDEARIIQGYSPYSSDGGFTVPSAEFPRS